MDAFGIYPGTYPIEIDDNVYDIAYIEQKSATLGSNMSEFYVATNDYQSSLKKIEWNLSNYTNPITITDLKMNQTTINETLWSLSITADGRNLFARNWNVGLWRYNIETSTMTHINTTFNLNQAYVTLFDCVGNFLVVGIRGMGLWLYNYETENWLRPDDEIPNQQPAGQPRC